MKQIQIQRNNRTYNAITSLDGMGLCDVSIYRKKLKPRWYQSKWEFLTSIVCCPTSVSKLQSTIEFAIDEYEKEESRRKNFATEYQKLEDVPFL